MVYSVAMPVRSLDELLDTTLPLNRKERYFTGTVLPALLGSDLQHLQRLADLVGVSEVTVRTQQNDCTVLLFTEYGIAESAIGKAAKRFAGLPSGKDTPDLVVLITEPHPVLIAVEAKLYDRPSRGDLISQLNGQRSILEPLSQCLAGWLHVDGVELVHVALLPSKLAAAVQKSGDLPVPVHTWEEVRDKWADVGGYYHQMLKVALDRYDDLVSRRIGYQDNELLGQDIVQRAANGTLVYAWMGRRGGVDGTEMKDDIASGTWKSTLYQVRKDAIPGNPNWFPIAEYIAAVVPPADLGSQDR